jgi:hypothetical protein
METEVEVHGICCFCAEKIARSATDPCRITVDTKGGKWQVWFCHGACFKDRLANLPDHPDFFSPAHF